MKNITIFGLWALTVLVGSFLFGVSTSFLEDSSGKDNDIALITSISIVASGVMSIPAIIIFLVANVKTKAKYGDGAAYKSKMFFIHFITGFVYFAISLIVILINSADMIGVSVLALMLLSYLPAGLLSWFIGFRMSAPKK